jgi:hypothetical protein
MSSPFFSTSTTSSATSRCPRSTQSSAVSLLPIPLRPVNNNPTPYTSTSDACSESRGAKYTVKCSVSECRKGVVDCGVRNTGTPRSLARSSR